MLASDAIARVRYRIRDVAGLVFPDAEILQYLSDAQAIVAAKGIQSADVAFRKSTTITDNMAVPSDWYAWVGEVPAVLRGGALHLPTGVSSLTADYWSWPARLTTTGQAIALPDYVMDSVIHKCVEICLDRNGFDSTADQNHTNAVVAARAAVTATQPQNPGAMVNSSADQQ